MSGSDCMFFFFTACNSIRAAVRPQTLIRGDGGCFGRRSEGVGCKSWRREEIAEGGGDK